MKLRSLIAAAAFITVLAAGGWADLRVGLMPAYNSIPLVVAEKKGLFEAEGIKVELLPFSSQLNRETALQTAAIDGTVSDMINAIQAWSQGFGARVTSASEGNFSLLSSPKSAVRTLDDWKKRAPGKIRTGLLENSIVFYLTEDMLTAAGADTASVDLVPILQLPARLEMLIAGQIEAATLPEPLATVAEARGAHRLADAEALGPTPGVLLFTKKALAEKSREISAFYRAYDKAVQEINTNPESYRAAIVERCEFPPAVTRLMKIPRFSPSFVPSAAEVAAVARWMQRKGLVSGIPAYADIVATGFAHAGNQ
ncbi:MAG: ABC transporter substrate-binding protein [Spirochaetia bacterium]